MRRSLIGILIAVLVTAVWYFFVVGPINERKDVARSNLESAQNEEFTLRTTLSRLRKIEENQLEYATAIGQLETAIPSAPRLAELIDDLNFLADETGLAWTSGSYGVPSPIADTDMYSIAVSVQVQGQFFEVLGYLYGISELDRVVRIDAVALSSANDEAGFHTMTATITGMVFTTSDVTIPDDLMLGGLEEPLEEETATEEDGGEDSAASEDTADGPDESSTTTTTEGA